MYRILFFFEISEQTDVISEAVEQCSVVLRCLKTIEKVQAVDQFDDVARCEEATEEAKEATR